MATPSTLQSARIMVTGGRGRIGTAVCAHLRTLGADPVVVSMPDIDTTDVAAVADAMKGVDLVVHLAAIPSPLEDAWPEILRPT